ncbi:dUTP diphosphatase [Crocinitomicaceae bacterium]|nr:dUTP diphosphatase [Crocinitomicaceae bacterium]
MTEKKKLVTKAKNKQATVVEVAPVAQTLKVKLLTETAKLPTRGSKLAGGLDIYADTKHPRMITEGKLTTIPTGIAMQIPEGYVGLVQPRSGFAFSRGVDHLAGVIDADYTGEIKLLLTSHAKNAVHRVTPGQRIAQIVIVPCLTFEAEAVDELLETERGEDGFGSTGS